MSRRQFHRFGTTLVMVLSLLFAQLALAAYVCPGQADSEAMAGMMAGSEPCTGMDEQQPVLCQQHAADPGKVIEAVKLPSVSLPAVVQEFVLPLVLGAQVAGAVPVAATPEARPPPAPVFLSTLRLRV